MFNKEKIQKNNSKILGNNGCLSSILEIINNLPINKKIRLQEKTVTPTKEQQEVVADEEYTGLSKVIVEGKGNDNSVFDGNAVQTRTVTSNDNILNKMIIKLPPIINTSEWTTLDYVFYYCHSLEEIPELDTSNVTSMSCAFYDCKTIKTIPQLDISKVTAMQSTFSNCTQLIEIPQLDTSKVTNFTNAFSGCSSLKKILLTNTDSATGMQSIFYNCNSLEEVSFLNTSKVTSMTSMFQNCEKIADIQLLDATKVTSLANIFNGCTNLTNLGGLKDLGKAFTRTTAGYNYYKLDLSTCEKLTHESLMNVINNLYDLNETYTALGKTLYRQSLVLGSVNMAKLTSNEIAIATNKGWDVS